MAMGQDNLQEKTPARHSAERSTATDAASAKDEAIALVGEHAQAIDPAVERRVLRKLDLFLLPAMVFGYGIVYW